MAIRCKLLINSIVHVVDDGRTLKMSPVTSSDPGSENHKFWSATPSGEASISLRAQDAGEFAPGQEWYLDIAPVAAQKSIVDVLFAGAVTVDAIRRLSEKQLPHVTADHFREVGALGFVRCIAIEEREGWQPEIGSDGQPTGAKARMATVCLDRPWGVGDDHPLRSAQISFSCVNWAAVAQLHVGGLYLIRLLRAPAEAA